MKVTYLITCSNETGTLDRLLDTVFAVLGNDELFILQDNTNSNPDTEEIVNSFAPYPNVVIHKHALNNDYGGHKNFGIEKATGDFIFQIDGDELPPESLLGDNLHAWIESNPTCKAYAVPRINDFRGVNQDIAKQWGWKLSISPSYRRDIVNWPDYQWRIFKKDFPKIRFTRRLHEKIEGYGEACLILPADESFALYHDKPIERQVQTNIRYNQMFSQEENKGHGVFDGLRVDAYHLTWDIQTQGPLPEFSTFIYPSKIDSKHLIKKGRVVNTARLFDKTYLVFFDEVFEND
jgi:glycosyltransferase involved in cell wall biosynthesis